VVKIPLDYCEAAEEFQVEAEVSIIIHEAIDIPIV
jgi:hypothetical protein